MNGITTKWIMGAWLAISFLLPSHAHAGGGPENVFLVVNAADPDSLTIANHFIYLRKIPTGSVLYLNWPKPPFKTDIDTFRERILGPTLKAIKARQLAGQIDYIIYSSGFPYAIDFSRDPDSATDKYAVGSITGMTYLAEHTMKQRVPSIRSGRSNSYAANVAPSGDGASHGFQSKYRLDSLGDRVAAGGGAGQRYYLSMMLGHTSGQRNNSVLEIVRYLMQGEQADGTQPDGTIYFVKNDNIRSTVRDSHFAEVVKELTNMGVKAAEIEGVGNERDVLPVKKKDVQGAMVGFYKHAWGLTNSKILPGAICENFTSYGGKMSGTASQSLLSNFLKFGAVASSGTVVEPYAILAKFPHPRLHVHYARGCSVAEAYYQSVQSPYQLLIVGDPLCQPWAKPPQVTIKGVKQRQRMTGEIEVQLTAKSKAGHKIRNFNIYVDGMRFGESLPGEPYTMDTTRLPNGYHELTVVAVEDTPIETQGRSSIGFVAVNLPSDSKKSKRDVGVAAEITPKNRKLLSGQIAHVRVHSEGARAIRLYRGRDLLGSIAKSNGRIELDTSELGSGPVTLRALAMPRNRAYKPVFGIPFTVSITDP